MAKRKSKKVTAKRNYDLKTETMLAFVVNRKLRARLERSIPDGETLKSHMTQLIKASFCVAFLLVASCGKAEAFPDVSGVYQCQPGAHGNIAGANAVVVATSDCHRIN